MSIRLPQQAGRFYAGSSATLRSEVEGCFLHRLGVGKLPKPPDSPLSNLVGLVSPHAGYMYSGPVAAHGYYLAASSGRPEYVIVLGPNHTGIGSGISIMTRGMWRTPLGDIEVGSELALSIQACSQLIDIDETAHRHEHSVEVQLPFLQYVYGSGFKLVPICMMLQDIASSRDVGNAVAKACKGQSALIIASTDLTHYEPRRVAQKKDELVMEAILRLDEEALQRSVDGHGISMCGYGPVSAALVAAKALGASRGIRLSYQTSGDITGDQMQVVGYCSAALLK